MPFDAAAARAQGYSQQEIDAYLASSAAQQDLKNAQVGVGSPAGIAAREAGILGSNIISGAEGLIGAPEEGINLLSRTVNPFLAAHGMGQFPTVPDLGATAASATNMLGITNNPVITPGMGPVPETERLLAAGGRGLGAAAPALVLGGPVGETLLGGALGGAGGELVHQGFPENSIFPVIAGGALGMLGGGIGGMARGAAQDTGQQVINEITGELGAPNATPWSAGENVRSLLLNPNVNTGIAAKTAKQLVNLKNGQQITNALLQDPVALQALKQSFPGAVNDLGAAMLNRSARQFGALEKNMPEINDALFDQSQQDRLNILLARPNVSPIGSGESLVNLLAGGALGSLGGHMLGIAGGEAMGDALGAIGGYAWTQARARMGARSILEPFLSGPATAGGLGAGVAVGNPVNTGLTPAAP